MKTFLPVHCLKPLISVDDIGAARGQPKNIYRLPVPFGAAREMCERLLPVVFTIVNIQKTFSKNKRVMTSHFDWRLGGEQLLFSHQTIDPTTNRPRFMANVKPMLLVCWKRPGHV